MRAQRTAADRMVRVHWRAGPAAAPAASGKQREEQESGLDVLDAISGPQPLKPPEATYPYPVDAPPAAKHARLAPCFRLVRAMERMTPF